MLQDLPEPHDDPSLHAGLDGVFVVQAVLEANQLLQENGDALVHVLPQHLAAVAATQRIGAVRGAADGDFSSFERQTHSLNFLLWILGTFAGGGTGEVAGC